MKSFFDISEEKITDKVFSRSLLASVVSIMLCIISLCSVTYAWFTTETRSAENTISSGSFDVVIYVSRVEDGAVISREPVSPDPDRMGRLLCELGAGEYLFELELTDEASVKGHCVVTLADDDVRKTDAIIGESTANADGLDITAPFVFRLVLTEPTAVLLEPRWGIVVHPDILYGETVSVAQ